MESNKPDLGSEGLDLRSYRPDLWSERPNLGSERDMGACLRLGWGDVSRKPKKIALCGFIWIICPYGAAAQKG